MAGALPTPVAALMSLTITVPPVVPSVFQSSVHVPAPVAVKKSVSPTIVKFEGLLQELVWMSLSRTVPALVPSLFQSSVFVDGVYAEK